MDTKIGVIGLGYVGLPLAIAASAAKYDVIGFDTNQVKLNLINQGVSPIEDISDNEIQSSLKNGFKVSSDFSLIQNSHVVIICVPTPLNQNREPDLSFIENCTKSFAKYLQKKTLIILESTVQPGTTREFLIPLIAENSKIDTSDFDFAYSPERIDPGNNKWKLKNTPKIVAGVNVNSTKRAKNFYSKFVDLVFDFDSLEVAELSKLLENTFRFINISFINEFTIFCRKFGVDIKQIITAASTKPYGFMPFYPSLGVGGHCIPVDPLYLSEKAREIGVKTKFIDLADEVNHQLVDIFIDEAENMVGELENKSILVIGLAFKPNIKDVRESRSCALILGLRAKGATVYWHDDLVQEWNGEKTSALNKNYDLAILATKHDYLNIQDLGNTPIIDTGSSTT